MEKAGGNYGTGTKEMQVPHTVWRLRVVLGAMTFGGRYTSTCEEGAEQLD